MDIKVTYTPDLANHHDASSPPELRSCKCGHIWKKRSALPFHHVCTSVSYLPGRTRDESGKVRQTMKQSTFIKVGLFYPAARTGGRLRHRLPVMPEKSRDGNGPHRNRPRGPRRQGAVSKTTLYRLTDLLREFSSTGRTARVLQGWHYAPSPPLTTSSGKDQANDCDDFCFQFLQRRDRSRLHHRRGRRWLNINPRNLRAHREPVLVHRSQTGLVSDKLNHTYWLRIHPRRSVYRGRS